MRRTLLLACALGVGTYLLPDLAAAEDQPETTETSVFVCSPYPIPECFEGDEPESVDGMPLEVPEVAPEAMEDPAPIIAPPAQPIASGTSPTYAG